MIFLTVIHKNVLDNQIESGGYGDTTIFDRCVEIKRILITESF